MQHHTSGYSRPALVEAPRANIGVTTTSTTSPEFIIVKGFHDPYPATAVVTTATGCWVRSQAEIDACSAPPRKLVWSPPPGAPRARRPYQR